MKKLIFSLLCLAGAQTASASDNILTCAYEKDHTSHFWYVTGHLALHYQTVNGQTTLTRLDKTRPLNFNRSEIAEFEVIHRMIAATEVELHRVDRARGYAIFPPRGTENRPNPILLEYYDQNGQRLGKSGWFGSHEKCLPPY